MALAINGWAISSKRAERGFEFGSGVWLGGRLFWNPRMRLCGGGDIIFRGLIAKMYTGMPKCNMGMGGEETSMWPFARPRCARIVAPYVLLHPPTSAEKGAKTNSRADRIVGSYVIIYPRANITHQCIYPKSLSKTSLRRYDVIAL